MYLAEGAAANTVQVADNVLNNLYYIKNLTGSGDKLFFGGQDGTYGTELYEGNARGTNLAVSIVNAPPVIAETAILFEASVFPNPATDVSTLRLKGSVEDATVIITDISGKVMWKKQVTDQYQVSLPVQTLSAGVYTVSVKNKQSVSAIRLVKE